MIVAFIFSAAMESLTIREWGMCAQWPTNRGIARGPDCKILHYDDHNKEKLLISRSDPQQTLHFIRIEFLFRDLTLILQDHIMHACIAKLATPYMGHDDPLLINQGFKVQQRICNIFGKDQDLDWFKWDNRSSLAYFESQNHGHSNWNCKCHYMVHIESIPFMYSLFYRVILMCV